MKLKDLSKQFNLTVLKDREFENLGYLFHRHPKMLVYLEQAEFIDQIDLKFVSAVIASSEVAGKIPKTLGIAIAAKPKEIFFKIHNFLAETDFYGKIGTKIHPRAKIDASVKLPENVQIGAGSVLEANVVIYPNTKIGKGVIIRSGSVIGSPGFEFKKFGQKIFSVAHAGGVWIDDEAEIKANCCIDRAVFGRFTKIGAQTKIDKGVNISHNNIIGRRCLITDGALINGSNQIGDDVYIGPGAIISNSLKIGDGAYISIGAVVVRDIKKNEKVTGNFAVEHKKFLMHLIKNDLT